MSNSKYRPGGTPTHRQQPNLPESLVGQALHEGDFRGPDSPTPELNDDGSLPDNVARRYLANAAKLMHDVMNLCGDAMKAIPPELAHEHHAGEIAREAQSAIQESGNVKRAKAHPYAGLMRIMMASSRMMLRCLNVLNPALFPKRVSSKKGLESAQAAFAMHAAMKEKMLT